VKEAEPGACRLTGELLPARSALLQQGRAFRLVVVAVRKGTHRDLVTGDDAHRLLGCRPESGLRSEQPMVCSLTLWVSLASVLAHRRQAGWRGKDYSGQLPMQRRAVDGMHPDRALAAAIWRMTGGAPSPRSAARPHHISSITE
jgi:hypothetical protein